MGSTTKSKYTSYVAVVRWAFQQIQSYNMLDTNSQGLALAAKAAGNKEEALNNMKYIKVEPQNDRNGKQNKLNKKSLCRSVTLC